MFRLNVLLITMALAGCSTVGPQYVTPPAPASLLSAPVSATADAASIGWDLGDDKLARLMALAEAGNLDLVQAQARLQAARAEAGQVEAKALPTLDGSLSGGRAAVTNSFAQINTQASSGLTASWEIDLFGGLQRQREAQAASVAASAADVRAAQMLVLADVAYAYIDYRSALAQQARLRDSIDLLRQQAELMQRRQQLGLIARQDAAQAQAQWRQQAASVSTYDLAAQQAVRRLAVLLQQKEHYVQSILGEATSVPVFAAPGPVSIPADLLARRPDIQREERKLAAAAANIGVAIASRYPTVQLSSTWSRSTLNGGQSSWSIGPSVSVRLLDGGRALALTAQRQAQYDEQLARWQLRFHEAQEEAANVLSRLESHAARQSEIDAAYAAARQASEDATRRYQRGLSTALEVVSSQREVNAIEASRIELAIERARQQVLLHKVLGGAWGATS